MIQGGAAIEPVGEPDESVKRAESVRDIVKLRLPADPRLFLIARLTVGGIGARMDLPDEKIEDVQLGIEALLTEASQACSRIDLELAIGESDLEATVALSDRAEPSDAVTIGLARVLRALGAELRLEDNRLGAQFDSLSDRVSDER